MNIWDIVIVAVLVLVIVGAVCSIVKCKKSGGCCGGSCGQCSCCNENKKTKK